MEYEMIREIFNQCSGNQMRDVFFQEVEVEDTDAFVQEYLVGSEVTCEKSVSETGSIIYDIVTDGVRSRIGFTPV